MDEALRDADRFGLDMDAQAARGHFLDQDADLQLCQPRPDAAVDAVAERQVASRVLAADVEPTGVGEYALVAIGRDVTQHDLVARSDVMPFELDIPGIALRRMCASGVCQRISSDTALSVSAGSASSAARWSGNLSSA